MGIRKRRYNYPQIIPDTFTFSPVLLGEVKNEIMTVGIKKSSSILVLV